MTDQEQTHGQIMDAILRSRGREPEPEQDGQPEVEQATDFDGGARSSAPAPVSMNDMLRRSAGYTR